MKKFQSKTKHEEFTNNIPPSHNLCKYVFHVKQLTELCTYVFCIFFFFSSFVTLFEKSTELGAGILGNPVKTFSFCNQVLISAQNKLLGRLQDDSQDVSLSIKPNVHVRIAGS